MIGLLNVTFQLYNNASHCQQPGGEHQVHGFADDQGKTGTPGLGFAELADIRRPRFPPVGS